MLVKIEFSLETSFYNLCAISRFYYARAKNDGKKSFLTKPFGYKVHYTSTSMPVCPHKTSINLNKQDACRKQDF